MVIEWGGGHSPVDYADRCTSYVLEKDKEKVVISQGKCFLNACGNPLIINSNSF